MRLSLFFWHWIKTTRGVKTSDACKYVSVMFPDISAAERFVYMPLTLCIRLGLLRTRVGGWTWCLIYLRHPVRVTWQTLDDVWQGYQGHLEQFNPLRAKFFRGNINIYLYCVSFLYTDTTQVVEILPQITQVTYIVYIVNIMAADVLAT